jgi:hypothetical protein
LASSWRGRGPAEAAHAWLAGVDPRLLSSSRRSPASTPGRRRAARRVSPVVEDAAGNGATICGPVQDDRRAADRPRRGQRHAGQRPGALHRAIATARSRPPSATATAACACACVVRPDRKPIAGATIVVLAQWHRAGSRFRPMGSLPTSRMGFSSRRRRACRGPALRLPLARQRRRLHRHARRPTTGARQCQSAARRTYAFRARVQFERGYLYVLGYGRRTHVTVGLSPRVAEPPPWRYPSAVGQ